MRSLSVKFVCALILGLVICLPGIASAYSQGWKWDFATENAPYQADTLEGFIVLPSTATFAGTGFSFTSSNPGWSSQLINSQYAIATGPVTSFLNETFYTNFTEPLPANTYMDWYAYSGGITGTIVAEYRQLVGSGTDFTAINIPRNDPSHNTVPLPPSVLLLGSGLTGLGLVGWRRKRADL